MSLVGITARARFESRTVQSKVQQATFRSLGHAGGAIRLTAARSIRRRKQPSLPGRPPHTRTGHLKRVIRYDVDPQQGEVVIGPTNAYARTIWNLHEFGGSVRPKARRLKPHPFRVGEIGPVRRQGATIVRAKLTTAAQADHATRLVQEENERRSAAARKRRVYPRRPFMGPALEAQRNRLPRFWANSVKG